jgi:hypothetical protein
MHADSCTEQALPLAPGALCCWGARLRRTPAGGGAPTALPAQVQPTGWTGAEEGWGRVAPAARGRREPPETQSPSFLFTSAFTTPGLPLPLSSFIT